MTDTSCTIPTCKLKEFLTGSIDDADSACAVEQIEQSMGVEIALRPEGERQRVHITSTAGVGCEIGVGFLWTFC